MFAIPAVANRRRARLFAAATVAVAAFSLTACQDGQGVREEGSAAVSSSQPAQPKGKKLGNSPDAPSGTGSSAAADSAGATGASGSKTANGSDKHVPCTGATTKVTAQSVARPLNHLLLTVTNTGSRTCALYHHPAAQFGNAQAVPPVIEETKPQAVTTLTPGDSGYAGVSLSAADGSGSHGHTAKTLKVSFFDAGNNGIGPAARPALPGKGVPVDDSLRVTYWLSDVQAALAY